MRRSLLEHPKSFAPVFPVGCTGQAWLRDSAVSENEEACTLFVLICQAAEIFRPLIAILSSTAQSEPQCRDEKIESAECGIRRDVGDAVDIRPQRLFDEE